VVKIPSSWASGFKSRPPDGHMVPQSIDTVLRATQMTNRVSTSNTCKRCIFFLPKRPPLLRDPSSVLVIGFSAGEVWRRESIIHIRLVQRLKTGGNILPTSIFAFMAPTDTTFPSTTYPPMFVVCLGPSVKRQNYLKLGKHSLLPYILNPLKTKRICFI
jgi:hypothetical protein